MLYQTVHGKPIIGGYLSHDLPYPLLDRLPIIRLAALARPAPDIITQNFEQIAPSVFSYFNIRYLMLHSDGGALRYGPLLRIARAAAGGAEPERVVRPDSSFFVYRVVKPGTPLPFLGIGNGWAEPQPRGDGTTFRALPHRAELLIYSAVPRAVDLDLRLQSQAGGELRLWLDGRELPALHMAQTGQHLQLHIDVDAGQHTLTLQPAHDGDVVMQAADLTAGAGRP
jgi:hypothetical protein